MKKYAILAAAVGGLLSGCVAYDAPVTEGGGYYSGSGGPYYSSSGYRNSDGSYYRDGGYYRDGVYYRSDRDGDGVRNSQDRRPDDPRRY